MAGIVARSARARKCPVGGRGSFTLDAG